jgi:hypothetical protein
VAMSYQIGQISVTPEIFLQFHLIVRIGKFSLVTDEFALTSLQAGPTGLSGSQASRSAREEIVP